MAPGIESERGAFLNVPFDSRFENLFLAYIAGVSACGLVPRSTLELPSGGRGYDRVQRIIKLIRACPISLHDLSRVEVDIAGPRTPRFNMAFELGIAVAWAEVAAEQEHTWLVFEAKRGRLPKSLSDLRGVDEYVHGGRVSGVFACLNNALARAGHGPKMNELWSVYRDLRASVSSFLDETGAQSVFEARMFHELVYAARLSAREHVQALAG